MADVLVAGVQFPFLMAVFVAAGAVHLVLDRLLVALGMYAWVWHPGLFRIAVFACLFIGAGLLYRY